MTSDIITKLEAATEAEQGNVILEAIDYARKQGWISAKAREDARLFVGVGAFLDAAMTLVPEGWEWQIISDDGAAVYKRSKEHGGYAIIFDGQATTPALALCAAALRAWEQGND
ncbi:hypothetical protein LCGC14_0231100 [marine sediment metagenome]|uniref:Phage ABA sandwich domain-containing protein n=1 Tax=marine sediment metagenome TaxID=412755 RepID=A0A0F9XE03_9ZZZZ